MSAAAAPVESSKPFMRTATPPTTNATMIARRAGDRFTGSILPQRSGGTWAPQPSSLGPGEAPACMLTGRHDSQLARDAAPAPNLPHPAEPPNEHRIVGERLRRLEEAVEQLVISGRREPETLTDRALLGDRQLPALAFEVQDLSLAIGELRRGYSRCSRIKRSHGGRWCKHRQGTVETFRARPFSPCEQRPTLHRVPPPRGETMVPHRREGRRGQRREGSDAWWSEPQADQQHPVTARHDGSRRVDRGFPLGCPAEHAAQPGRRPEHDEQRGRDRRRHHRRAAHDHRLPQLPRVPAPAERHTLLPIAFRGEIFHEYEEETLEELVTEIGEGHDGLGRRTPHLAAHA